MKKRLLLITVWALTAARLVAQLPGDAIPTRNMPVLPVITNTDLPGAPLLSQPVLITGTEQEIRTEKHGLVYPSFYDWNRDGKIDLLLGEFETGQKGSYIKVYLNTGTNNKPRYTGKYFYATDLKGDTITAYQWCCIGIHPRFTDIDGDGITDMLTGQYNPGAISWWKGSEQGFLPRQFVPQKGYHEGMHPDAGNNNQLDTASNEYWNYTSAGFGDFNGDGLADLFVGGFGELRIAVNEGNSNAPRFGLRKNLLDVDGLPLSVVPPSATSIEKALAAYRMPRYSGIEKSFITPVDWDGDGVLDLLVTHLYGKKNTKDPVVFFRGIQTDKGLRFEKARPLFTAEAAAKTFPGCQPNIAVTDYNNDGIPDLVIGISLPTINGNEVDSLVAWSYYHDLGIEYPGKDAGRALLWEKSLDTLIKKVKANPDLKDYYLGKLDDYRYLTLRHKGYVYVMYGQKNLTRAIAAQKVIAKAEVRPPVNESLISNQEQGPVSFQVKSPKVLTAFSEGIIEVTINIKDGWYGYANTKANEAMGWIPIQVSYELPEALAVVSSPVTPVPVPKGTTDIYKGSGNIFAQPIKASLFKKDGSKLPEGSYPVRLAITYQTCNEEMCLPPVTEKVSFNIALVKE